MTSARLWSHSATGASVVPCRGSWRGRRRNSPRPPLRGASMSSPATMTSPPSPSMVRRLGEIRRHHPIAGALAGCASTRPARRERPAPAVWPIPRRSFGGFDSASTSLPSSSAARGSRSPTTTPEPRGGHIRPRPAGYWLMECFPTSTWRTSGLEPLPGHRRAPAEVVERFARRLVAGYGLPTSAVTRDHDDLQAVVSTLPAVGLLGGPARVWARGQSARSVGGVLVEGLIWDAAPAGEPTAPVPVRPAATTLLVDERDVGLETCIERGVALFRELVRRANAGEAVGISYKGFVEHVHGASFCEVRGRPWSQSDTSDVLHLANQITGAAGRQSVRRGNVVIQAGMDTFIWPKTPRHTRSARAWRGGLPYSRDEWLFVFPDGTRRLIAED